MIVARDRIRGLDLQISSRFGGRFYRVSLIIYENVRLWRNGKFGSNGNGHYHRDNWIFGWNAFGPREKPFQLITRNGIGICVPLLSTKIFLIFNFVAGDHRTAFARAYYPSLYKNGYRPGIRAKINIRITSIAEALSRREREKKKGGNRDNSRTEV